MDDKQDGSGGSFEERLRAARDRQGLDGSAVATGKRPDPADRLGLARAMRAGVEMVSALVVAIAIGWGLDRLLGTRPVLLILFVFLGVSAGVLNVIRTFTPGRTGAGRG
jgi:ATP synthase protein I